MLLLAFFPGRAIMPAMNTTLWDNVSVWCGIAGWIAAQVLKLFTFMRREGKFDFAFLFRLGGMPSSHTAACAAAATSVGLRDGFGSTTFTVILGLLCLIMVDAQSVRRAAGIQARLLNKMADEFYQNRRVTHEHLVEFLGHTRLEVGAGLLLGILIALAVHFLLLPALFPPA
jgi:hypothetical protein